MHPQSLAELIGRPLPPAPVECSPGDVAQPQRAVVPASVEPAERQQVAQPCGQRDVIHDGRFWRVHCPVHGFVGYASRFVDAAALSCVEGEA